MGSLIAAVDGKKAYLLAIGGVVYAWLGAWLGHITWQEAANITYEAAMGAAIRHGVSKAAA